MSQSTPEREARIRSSALWAGWADALGFISELTDSTGLSRRLHGQPLRDPVSWRRRVGGKFGVQADLPAGCYSDDTQLRLATSRAIGPHGFDVEAFARVEMPVWPTYALGGGRASKAAAAHLAKPTTPWFANHYDGWHRAGGNGAAMRIQPHVWAAPDAHTESTALAEVITNAVTTHGHPRALVGAVLHAAALARALADGEPPGPAQWPELLERTAEAVTVFDERAELATVWRPSWEQASGEPLTEAWRRAVAECRDQLKQAKAALTTTEGNAQGDPGREQYRVMLTALDLFDPATRGSGTATVTAALALAAWCPGDPATVARLAAGAVGSDTDTIATMAAAVAGAAVTVEPPTPLLDSEYLSDEARRLHRIAVDPAAEPGSFQYPDLLHWTPPRSQLDGVGHLDGRLILTGLAWLSPCREQYSARTGNWAWHHSDLGQTFLTKQRSDLRTLATDNAPRRRLTPPATVAQANIRTNTGPDAANAPTASAPPSRGGTVDENPASSVASRSHAQHTSPAGAELTDGHLHESATAPSTSAPSSPPSQPSQRPGDTRLTRQQVDVAQMLRWVKSHPAQDQAVGYAVRRLIELGSLEQLIAFVIELRQSTRTPGDPRPPG